MSSELVELVELQRRLAGDPSNLGLRVALGGALLTAGRTAEGVEIYRSVAIAYRDQGLTQQAIAVCHAVLDIAPTDPVSRGMLAALGEPERRTSTDKIKNSDDPFERGGPFAPEPVFPALEQDGVFLGTIELIRPLVDQKSKMLYLNVDVNVPNRQDKYGRWLLLQGLPVEATIIPEKRAE